MHPYIELAYQAIKTYLETRQTVAVSTVTLSGALAEPGAVFVTLHTASGQLRGCRGTLIPAEPSLAEAIIKTAISSAVDDPRFPPMTLGEMAGLQIKVDVLSPLEPVSDIGLLDEKKYGVVVQSGRKRAVLLPDIASIENVKHQLEMARRKAGIPPQEPVTIYRFTVTRYYSDSK